jgi:hypothetical protein
VTVVVPEPDDASEDELALLDTARVDIGPGQPILGDIPSLRSEDRGGPTTYYQGDVSGILEIAIIYDNMINGREPLLGLSVEDGTTVDDVLLASPPQRAQN